MKRIMPIAVLLLAGLLPGGGRNQVQASEPANNNHRIALLQSTTTSRFFGLHYPRCSPPTSFYLGADESQRYWRGWQFALERFRYDYDIIRDDDIIRGALSQYQVLILSNTAALPFKVILAVFDWVHSGGRLIATFGSGYKSTLFDPHAPDGMHISDHIPLLWGDPFSGLFSTQSVDPNGVDIRVDRFVGPTAKLAGHLVNNVLHYGANANLLVRPPVRFVRSFGSVIIDNPAWKGQPAILLGEPDRGLALYYAFAPEYLVSKEFGLPAPERCPDGQNWVGRSYEGLLLMEGSLEFMTTVKTPLR